MKKYQINRSCAELKPDAELFAGCTLIDNPNGQEYVSDIINTLEEARLELSKYSTTVWNNGKYILVEEYQIIAGEYDKEEDCLMEHEEVELTQMAVEDTTMYQRIYGQIEEVAIEQLEENDVFLDEIENNELLEKILNKYTFIALRSNLDTCKYTLKEELNDLIEKINEREDMSL